MSKTGIKPATLTAPGWKIPEDAFINVYGNIEFFEGNPEDVTGTYWEVNPDTGKSRHRGIGAGSIWTEWE